MQQSVKTLSGRKVVVGMFLFAAVFIAVLWTYTWYHRVPFAGLQSALAERFPGSTPKVEGGQRKIHQDTPKILRIILKVDFNPRLDEERTEQFAGEVIEFTRRNYDVGAYEILEIHLFQLQPEREIIRWSTERKVAELPPVD